MSLLTFPFTTSADAPQEGIEIADAYNTRITTSQTGYEQRRQLQAFPRAALSAMKWDRSENASTRLDSLWDFYQQCRGALLPFIYFDLGTQRTWGHTFVGVGTGAQSVWDLPSKSATYSAVYVGGASVSNYTVAAGAGSNGRDRITFTSPLPASGKIIQATFTGQRAWVVRFANDRMSYRAFAVNLYEFGLELIEVRGES